MKVGDWVITKANVLGKNIKAISIIMEIKPGGTYITSGVRKYSGLVFVVPKRNLTLMKVKVEKEDIETLINLALDTKDEDWFNELHRKLSSAKG